MTRLRRALRAFAIGWRNPPRPMGDFFADLSQSMPAEVDVDDLRADCVRVLLLRQDGMRVANMILAECGVLEAPRGAEKSDSEMWKAAGRREIGLWLLEQLNGPGVVPPTEIVTD